MDLCLPCHKSMILMSILVKKNPEFKAFLKQLSQEEATISLESLRQELAL